MFSILIFSLLLQVRIWSRSFERAEKLAKEIGAKAFESVEDTVKDADVIVTVTLSKDPVVFGKWTKNDCLINSKIILPLND